MILGLDRHPVASCFIELDDAITELQRDTGDTRTFVLNAHSFPDEIPAGAIVFNLENVGTQLDPGAFPGHRVVDFSLRNIDAWRVAGRDVEHFPVGYHASMERFALAPKKDIDVIFTGCRNERRQLLLDALADRGLNVVSLPPGIYGARRDQLLARSKLALGPLYYPSGVFPALRVAHLVANHVPVLSERCDEGWNIITTCAYEHLVGTAEHMVKEHEHYQCLADLAYEAFKRMPMVLPS